MFKVDLSKSGFGNYYGGVISKSRFKMQTVTYYNENFHLRIIESGKG